MAEPQPLAEVAAPAEAPAAQAPSVAQDTQVAVKSAAVLTLSLLGTWGIALVVRFFLPRYMGPEQFGAYNFADAYSATWFVLLGLGIETYIQKEIPVRPQHASEFFGGLVVTRAALSVLVLAGMATGLALGHRSPQVHALVAIFGVAQVISTTNATLAALLHASRQVSGLAWANVSTKAIFALGVGVSVLMGWPLTGLAASFLASEAVKAFWLWRLVQRHAGVRWGVDLAVTKAAVAASLPFYVNAVAINVYSKVDVSVISFLSSDREVGYYSAAQTFAGLSMFISPLIGWVLMPLLSRAGARSADELFGILRRAIELVITLIIPVTLIVGLGADVFVKVLFKEAFVPATLALRILAPLFVLSYLAILLATSLNLLGRAWTVTAISCSALVVSALMNTLLVPRAWAALGTGGAGAGAAVTLIVVEALVCIAFAANIGRQAFDARSVTAILKSLVLAAGVIVLDSKLQSLGWLRLVVDGGVYVALALLSGAVRTHEIVSLVGPQLAQRLRRARPA